MTTTSQQEQRIDLILDNTQLILQWLALLDDTRQATLIGSLLRKFSLAELKQSHDHMLQQVGQLSGKKDVTA